MIKKIVLVVSLTVAGLIPDYAFAIDGNKLLANSSSNPAVERGSERVVDFFSSGQFIGYVQGAVDAQDGTHYCLPPRASWKQVFAIVTKYLNEHPEELHLKAAELIAKSLATHFPCQK